MAVIHQGHLFDVEDDEVLDGADGGQQGAVECPDPADGLAVHNLQDVLGDGKLLLAPPLGQATVTVVHYESRGEGERERENCQKRRGEKKREKMTYFLGNSTKTVTAPMMMKSKIMSLYISWPTRDSQHG